MGKATRMLNGKYYKSSNDRFLQIIHKKYGGENNFYPNGNMHIFPEFNCNHRKVLMEMHTASINPRGYANSMYLLDVENYDGKRSSKSLKGPKNAFVATELDSFCFRPPFQSDESVCSVAAEAGNCLIWCISVFFCIANISHNLHLSRYYVEFYLKGERLTRY